jgi:hypothetical protein
LAEARNKHLELLSSSDGGWNIPIKVDAFLGIDSIWHYNPVGYGNETIEIDSNMLNPLKFNQVGFRLCYFFEQNPFRLSCKIERIGLLKDVKDEKGNLRYRQPIFFIKP